PGRPQQRKNGHKAGEAPPPVVTLADQAADLEGELEEALQSARKAVRFVRPPRNLIETQGAMSRIQRCLIQVLRQQLAGVADYEVVNTLMQMGRELGDGWPKWTELIKTIIDGCRDRLV